MKAFFKIVFILGVTLSLFSCDQNRRFEANQDIDNQAWFYEDTIRFEVAVDDLSELNAYINIRHSFYFDWRNMWLQMYVFQEDSLIYNEPINVELSQPNGQWYGKCSGDICFYQFPLEDFKNYAFSDTGSYRFELIQDMRENPLKGISSIGLRLELSEQKE